MCSRSNSCAPVRANVVRAVVVVGRGRSRHMSTGIVHHHAARRAGEAAAAAVQPPRRHSLTLTADRESTRLRPFVSGQHRVMLHYNTCYSGTDVPLAELVVARS